MKAARAGLFAPPTRATCDELASKALSLSIVSDVKIVEKRAPARIRVGERVGEGDELAITLGNQRERRQVDATWREPRPPVLDAVGRGLGIEEVV